MSLHHMEPIRLPVVEEEVVVGNMGVKNFTQQMAIINKSAAGVQYLKDYAISMNAMLENINAVWIGGRDKAVLLDSVVQSVKKAIKIANNYDTFAFNAKRWLNDMNELEKISQSIQIKNSISIVTKGVLKQNSSKLYIKIDELEELSTIINDYGTKMEIVCSAVESSKHLLDRLIVQRFPPRYSLNSISKQVAELKADNAVIVADIKKICAKYRRVDKEIQDIANELIVAGSSSGAVDAQTKNSSALEKVKKKSSVEEKKADAKKSDIEKKLQSILESCGIKSSVAGKIIEEIIPEEGKHWLELGEDWSDGRYDEIWADVSDIVMDIDYGVQYGEVGNIAILLVKASVSKINQVFKTGTSTYKIVKNNIKKNGLINGLIKSIIPVGKQNAKIAVDASVGMIKNTIESLPFVGDAIERTEKLLKTITGENISSGLDNIAQDIETLFDYGCKKAQQGVNKILKIDNVSSGINKVEKWLQKKLAG